MKKISKRFVIGLVSAALLVSSLWDAASAATSIAMTTQFCDWSKNVSIDTNQGAQQELCFSVTNRENTEKTFKLHVGDWRLVVRGWVARVLCYSDYDYKGRNQGPLYNATDFDWGVKSMTFTLQPNETKVATAVVDVPSLWSWLWACMVTEAWNAVETTPGAITVQLRKTQFFHLY